MNEPPQIILVYDRECPVCTAYCRALAIRQLDQGMQILNAREDHPVVREIKRLGLDLDEGFVLRIGTSTYHGAEAIHRLALLSTSNGVFNRLNYFIFRSQRLSRLLYPVLRSGRNLILLVLSRKRIMEGQGESSLNAPHAEVAATLLRRSKASASRRRERPSKHPSG